MQVFSVVLKIQILLILISFNSFSQSYDINCIALTGVVMDKDSLNELSESNILINYHKGAITDTLGRFSVLVNKKDTLLFSRIGYKEFKYIIPDSMYGHEFITAIFMSKDTISLGEILISPRLNRQQLKTDFLSYNKKDIDAINATNNLKVATYQSYANIPENDATANQKMVLDQQAVESQYKGMISPDNMISFGLLVYLANVPSEIERHSKNRNILLLSIKEKEYLTQEYLKHNKVKNK